MTRRYQAPPPRFEIKQAIYAPSGHKIGWVSEIRNPFTQRPDLDYAVVILCAGGTAHYSLAQLEEGEILRKCDLKFRGVARSSAPPPPTAAGALTMCVGARIYSSDGLYQGTLTKLMREPWEHSTVLGITDLFQSVTTSALQERRQRIGQRNPKTPVPS